MDSGHDWTELVERHPQAEQDTARHAMARGAMALKTAMDRLDNDQPVAAQTAAETALLEVLSAMRALGMEPEAALKRALARTAEAADRQRSRPLLEGQHRVNFERRRIGFQIGVERAFHSPVAREIKILLHDEALDLLRRSPALDSVNLRRPGHSASSACRKPNPRIRPTLSWRSLSPFNSQ